MYLNFGDTLYRLRIKSKQKQKWLKIKFRKPFLIYEKKRERQSSLENAYKPKFIKS